ncbi:antitoxin VbhA family protein [Rhizobium leguminosarum]|uniref:antitoxin VbhA family protein n=1 Tax=Rhizobium leguminosarum TaxID=384 RepID=UPI003F9CA04A
MTRRPYISTPEEIVQDVIASARLEGQTLEPEAIAVARRIANGEMTSEEIKAWQRARVAEIQAEARSRK